MDNLKEDLTREFDYIENRLFVISLKIGDTLWQKKVFYL